MKHLTYHFCIVLLLCLTSSCAKIERSGDGSADKRICYEVVQDRSSATKAAGAYPEDLTFASFAWYLPFGKTWASNSADAIPYLDYSEISYDTESDSWYDAANTYYWPQLGNLTFFSISPYSVSEVAELTNNYGFWISDWNVHENQDVDIMVADVQSDINNSSMAISDSGVPTIFRHKLALIDGFTFNTFKDYAPGHTSGGTYKRDDKRFFITSIKVNNIRQEGRFVSGNAPSATNIGLWQVSDSAVERDYVWFSGSEEIVYDTASSESVSPNQLSSGMSHVLVLPQTFADPGTSNVSDVPNIEVTYTTWTYTDNSGAYTSNVTTVVSPLYTVLSGAANRIDMNKRIVFGMTINLNSNLIVWAPDQIDWTGNDFYISI